MAKSLADRIDFGEISLPPTKGDLDSIKEILKHQVDKPVPNLVRHVYKVRRGKLTRVKVWQYADLGTCRTTDLFITDNDGKLLSVEVTQIESANLDDVIDDNSIDHAEVEATQEEQQEATKTLFDW